VNSYRMALHCKFQLSITDIIGVFMQLSLKMRENRADSVKDGLSPRLCRGMLTPLELAEVSAFNSASNNTLAFVRKETVKAETLAKYGIRFKDEKTGMEFVRVQNGLTIYYIGMYEVTEGQWQRIMENDSSHFSSCGADCPVMNVSWNDAQNFIERLNRQSDLQYRLPSEAEWHYACTSGGRNEEYCGDNDVDAVAWYDNNSGNMRHRVGTKQPNGFGIYDMSGNVWEWVQDASGSSYVTLGGSWSDGAAYAQASTRSYDDPDRRRNSLGFRLVAPLVQ
ncbi:MAG: formylglycine-generating enzyme family protein, partial [Geobacteraceae bacterium]